MAANTVNAMNPDLGPYCLQADKRADNKSRVRKDIWSYFLLQPGRLSISLTIPTSVSLLL